MGVILGTLTTRDGRVIPLPDAAGELVAPRDEYRKEERKYSKCIHRPITNGVWSTEQVGRPVTRQVALYFIKTESLRRQGEIIMKKDKIKFKNFITVLIISLKYR